MILVCGFNGFIGSHLSVELLNNNYSFIGVDNFVNSRYENIFNIQNVSGKHINFIKCNILDGFNLEDIFKKYPISAVIHLASLKSVGESLLYPAKYYYNNVLGSKRLFSLMRKYCVKNLIFSSSATVYGKPIKLPLYENHPIRATNPYGQNKIDIENILLSDPYFKSDCSVKILRYFNPVGAHPSGLIGENPKGIPNNLMPYILKVANREYKRVSVFGKDYETHDGTGVRDFIHIMDLVEGHIKALNYQKKGISIFNLGTGHGYSVLDLIKTFEDVNNVTVPFEISARRPGDVASVYANPHKAESVLGFKAKRTLENMCFDAWTFAQKKD